jgi:hypothetical protein
MYTFLKKIHSLATRRRETYLAQTHIPKTEATGNDTKIVLSSWTEFKTLHKQHNAQSATQRSLDP